ncbi:MAG: hypothetical protein EXS01_01975 [Phycisphaerales bacterium]|nr:hypothetical protein [Phycisphaerales bacterium]
MTPHHPSQFGSDDSESFRPAEGANDGLESQLNARGARLRNREGLAARISSSTLSLIGSEQPWGLLVSRQKFARWGVGLAVAASLVAAVFLMNVSSEPTTSTVVATADRGGTIAEPVLVSLLAGSEWIAADGSEEFVMSESSAVPILRTRDASFGDLNSEVQLILASAGNQ